MSGATQFSYDATEFPGKRALVTGGTKGMGEAMLVVVHGENRLILPKQTIALVLNHVVTFADPRL
jgi:hypothetical protein